MPKRHNAAWRSIRARVVATTIIIATLAVTFAGVIAYSLEHQRLEQTAHADLFTQYETAQMLNNRGRDPLTGAPFHSLDATLDGVVAGTISTASQGTLALHDGQVVAQSNNAPGFHLGRDTALIEQVSELAPDRSPRIHTITTEVTTYYVVTADMVVGHERGRLVFAQDQQALYKGLNDSYRTYVGVAIGSIILFGFIAWIAIGRLLAPIQVMQRVVQRVNDTEPTHRIPVRGDDDLSDLGRNINAMLDRLAKTFEDQQAFYDDVSHELRTPLTIVRGHLEILDPDDPEDASATKKRTISELDRMNLLVDDMMTLAKARRPDFARRRPTDVAELTDTTFEKAQSLGDRRWVLDDIADAEIMLDPRRIEQALLELSRNAVKFTEPGQVIALGSDVTADEVRLWVRDEGIGIPPERLPHVTKRHVRGAQSSRTEGQGLGLAIVDSITQAHSGTLHLTSRLGAGTTVTMRFPYPREDTHESYPDRGG